MTYLHYTTEGQLNTELERTPGAAAVSGQTVSGDIGDRQTVCLPVCPKQTQGGFECRAYKVRLRLIPSLSARALQTKQDKELALWYCLRSLDTQGSGVLDVARVLELLCKDPPPNALGRLRPSYSGCGNLNSGFSTKGMNCAIGLTPASCRLSVSSGVPKPTASFSGGQDYYTIPTLYRLLASGEGIFWHRTSKGQQLVLAGVKQVVKRLGVDGDYLDRYFRLERGEFNSLAKRRASLFASTLKPGDIKSKPIARDTIESITGINKRQQRRYDNIAGIKGVQNSEVVNTEQGKHQYRYNRRMPNIYHTRQLSQPHGMLKRSIRRCKGLCESERLQAPVKSRFTSWKGLRKAFRGGLEMGHVLLPRALRLKPGRLEWVLEMNTTPELRMAGF